VVVFPVRDFLVDLLFGWLFFLSGFFVWLVVSPSFLSEPGFTGYEGFSGWHPVMRWSFFRFGIFYLTFFVWLVVWLVVFCLAFLFGLLFHLLFCLNQDLQDIRDFQDGRLMCSGRFSGSGFFI
jgi:hypothetical protein